MVPGLHSSCSPSLEHLAHYYSGVLSPGHCRLGLGPPLGLHPPHHTPHWIKASIYMYPPSPDPLRAGVESLLVLASPVLGIGLAQSWCPGGVC